ncbi:MAG: hypothetical protein IT195_12505 [Microthrixaceae bacterium]|nr:hypothetical protein [Microthrixaceae bacterium]
MIRLPNLDPATDNIHAAGCRNLLAAVIEDAATADPALAVRLAHATGLLTDDQLEHAWNTGTDPLKLIDGAA